MVYVKNGPYNIYVCVARYVHKHTGKIEKKYMENKIGHRYPQASVDSEIYEQEFECPPLMFTITELIIMRHSHHKDMCAINS